MNRAHPNSFCAYCKQQMVLIDGNAIRGGRVSGSNRPGAKGGLTQRTRAAIPIGAGHPRPCHPKGEQSRARPGCHPQTTGMVRRRTFRERGGPPGDSGPISHGEERATLPCRPRRRSRCDGWPYIDDEDLQHRCGAGWREMRRAVTIGAPRCGRPSGAGDLAVTREGRKVASSLFRHRLP
jgi:hypothetical protein